MYIYFGTFLKGKLSNCFGMVLYTGSFGSHVGIIYDGILFNFIFEALYVGIYIYIYKRKHIIYIPTYIVKSLGIRGYTSTLTIVKYVKPLGIEENILNVSNHY